MSTILGSSETLGHTPSNIYYTCTDAEDISIEFNPTFNGQTPNDIGLRMLMGPTIWDMADHRLDKA
eukprot:5720494-Amphidinium_carterae.1